MPTYQFGVSYHNVNVEDLDQLEVIAASAPYAHVACVDGDTRILATIAAPSAVEAVEILVQAVHAADPNAVPMTVDLPMVSISDIASMVGLGRESVRLWTTGERGPGDFPSPIDTVGDRIKVWTTHDVWQWLAKYSIPHPEERPLSMAEAIDGRRAIERLRRNWRSLPALAAAEQWSVAKHEETTVPVRQARHAQSAA
jgi:hypothetical protein